MAGRVGGRSPPAASQPAIKVWRIVVNRVFRDTSYSRLSMNASKASSNGLFSIPSPCHSHALGFGIHHRKQGVVHRIDALAFAETLVPQIVQRVDGKLPLGWGEVVFGFLHSGFPSFASIIGKEAAGRKGANLDAFSLFLVDNSPKRAPTRVDALLGEDIKRNDEIYRMDEINITPMTDSREQISSGLRTKR